MKIVNPFPGIRPFEEKDNKFFFGRENQISALEKKLKQIKFVAVVGLSASGKSSLIKAGLIPNLKKTKEWDICIFRPQNSPLKNLAEALSQQSNKFDSNSEQEKSWKDYIYPNLDYSSNGIVETYTQSGNKNKLLLVIDQFEELFTYPEDFKSTQTDFVRDERIHFVNLLTSTVKQNDFEIYIIITIRSDFVGRCSEYRGLPELINDGQFLVPRLTRNELRKAIMGPLEVQNVSISPMLLNALLNDIHEDPDQLPVMQHALMRTWDHWKENNPSSSVINGDSYEAVGGMNESIGSHADEIFEKFSIPDQKKIEGILKQIATREKNGEFVRRSTGINVLKELLGTNKEELDRLTKPFRAEGCNFLMPSRVGLDEDSNIDVAHEAFIRKWKKVENWINDEQKDVEDLHKLVKHYINSKSDNTGKLEISFLNKVKKNKRFNDLSSNNSNYTKALFWAKMNLPDSAKAFFKSEKEKDLLNFSFFLRKIYKDLFFRKNGKYITGGFLIFSIFGLLFYFLNHERVKAELENENIESQKQRVITELKLLRLDSATSSNIDSLYRLRKKIDCLENYLIFKDSIISMMITDHKNELISAKNEYERENQKLESGHQEEKSKLHREDSINRNKINEWKRVYGNLFDNKKIDSIQFLGKINQLKSDSIKMQNTIRSTDFELNRLKGRITGLERDSLNNITKIQELKDKIVILEKQISDFKTPIDTSLNIKKEIISRINKGT